MGLVHTWTGLVLGSVLFAIFWMGSLSAFDQEIDRWMMPGTRLIFTEQPVGLDRLAARLEQLAPNSPRWVISLPSEREPVARLLYQDDSGARQRRYLNMQTGELIPDQGTLGGTGFIFPFHFSLHLKWMNIGYWLVGLAGMAMLLALVSGVVIHRKILAEFFTFRRCGPLPRASLDLHNLSGVLFLPFHFLITLSGLIIFMGIYFPQAVLPTYAAEPSAQNAFVEEAYGRYNRPPAGIPGNRASLDLILRKAHEQWPGGEVSQVTIWHPGDINSYVEMRRSHRNTVTMNLDQLYFDAGSGQLLSRFEAAPVMGMQRFISGMHFLQFEHWLLRWLYFIAGLAGCVMIATGFVFWVQSRRKRHKSQGLAGATCVEALATGSITGIVLATLTFFLANRMLPANFELPGLTRSASEVAIFYLAWLLTFVHAVFRNARAWQEQCLLIGGAALLAVLLNGVTTGDHLVRSVGSGVWAIAGTDLVLLVSVALAWLVAWRLRVKPERVVFQASRGP